MKKEDKKLIINQANYEGYLQLYKIRKNMTKEEIEYSNKFIKMILIITGIGLSSAIVSAPFQIMGLASNIVETEIMALMLIEVGIGIIGYKKQNDFTKKNEQKIKEKYPYVDIKIDEEEIINSLIEAKVIRYEGNNDLYYICDNEYKNHLEVEKVKKEYFEETKYEGYAVETQIPKVELEKPKVKKLVR